MSKLVSVLLPVYNGEEHLAEAIDSVLCQTFTNFELIIIDDGSTDNTPKILNEYAEKDSRIVLVFNEKNGGIGNSLNKGIALAKGDYIARMDGDDVSLPERLEKEVNFLDTHPEVALVATKASMVDKDKNPLPCWKEDVNNVTPSEIRNILPFANCISHPSILIHADILREYLYDISAPPSEDYELWLRLAADNHVLAKIDEFLLLYRFNYGSTTFKEDQEDHPYFRRILAKRKFLLNRLKKLKFGGFEYRVFKFLVNDIYRAYIWTPVYKYRQKRKQTRELEPKD